MSSIQKVNSIENQKKPILTPRNTGYAAAAALILASGRAITTNKSVKRTHKMLGWLALGLTVLHIGLIEFYHLKFKNGKK